MTFTVLIGTGIVYSNLNTTWFRLVLLESSPAPLLLHPAKPKRLS